MTTDALTPPFERDELLDTQGIVGARWWNRELKDEERKQSRRAALTMLGVGVVGVGVVGAIAAAASAMDYEYVRQPSLGLQRRFGWSFGAFGESITFDGRRVIPFDPSRLRALREECVGRAYSAQQNAAIFDAIFHRPSETPGESYGIFLPLDTYLVPVVTNSMGFAYRMGQALARVLARAPRRVAIVADIVGPDAVALAAGLAESFAPVWKFDHWPHPRGVVPAHMTLAAAAFFQPRFADAASRRAADAPPVYLMDRNRLRPYSDSGSYFDNRYIPSLASVSQLEAEARTRDILYIAPTDAALFDADDLNPTLVSYRTRGISVRTLTGQAFFSSSYEAPAPTTDPIEQLLQQAKIYYGGDLAHEEHFVQHYFGDRDTTAPPSDLPDSRAWAWEINARPTFQSALGSAGIPVAPIGTVEIVTQNNRVLGLRSDRNGSWNRVSSSSSWGG
ncbi:MAG: hypothetical protein U0269_21445 [Polyangiales bacterium]